MNTQDVKVMRDLVEKHRSAHHRLPQYSPTSMGLEFDKLAHGTAEDALELVKQRINWLEHVEEGELTEAHQAWIVLACRRFWIEIQPLVAHYLDGDEIQKGCGRHITRVRDREDV